MRDEVPDGSLGGGIPAAEVTVVGSLNRDIRVDVDRRPGPGETVLARSVSWSNGGKGGNQAVAAARAGAAVRMVGAVGDDEDGHVQLAELSRFGADVTAVRRVMGRPTGRAFIDVTPDGENSIVVHAGANLLVDPVAREQYLAGCVVVVQTEIGRRTSEEAAEAARRAHSRLVVNAAPVVPAESSLYRDADPLVVNEHEAREIAELAGPVDPGVLGRAVRARTAARSVVVTLGGEGAVLVEGDTVNPVAPRRVPQVVDTTGAGDTFVGVLAARIAAGSRLNEACEAAATAAAECVQWTGARPAPPAVP